MLSNSIKCFTTVDLSISIVSYYNSSNQQYTYTKEIHAKYIAASKFRELFLKKIWKVTSPNSRNFTHGLVFQYLDTDFSLKKDKHTLTGTCSSDRGSPLIGSVPFSLIYFSSSLFSKTCLLVKEMTGSSGTSLLSEQISAIFQR